MLAQHPLVAAAPTVQPLASNSTAWTARRDGRRKRAGTTALVATPPDDSGGYTDVADLSSGGAEYKLAAFVMSELRGLGSSGALPDAALQPPLLAAQTQVVAGINHRIVAEVGLSSPLTLQIYEQSWTSTLELTKVELGGNTIVEGVSLDYAAFAGRDTDAGGQPQAPQAQVEYVTCPRCPHATYWNIAAWDVYLSISLVSRPLYVSPAQLPTSVWPRPLLGRARRAPRSALWSAPSTAPATRL